MGAARAILRETAGELVEKETDVGDEADGLRRAPVGKRRYDSTDRT